MTVEAIAFMIFLPPWTMMVVMITLTIRDWWPEVWPKKSPQDESRGLRLEDRG